MNAANWRTRAACLNRDPELFFPVGTTGPALSHLAAAQQVCLSCPVRGECLQWAFDQHIDHGVWGGLSEEQRRSLRRRTARQRTKPTSPLTSAPTLIHSLEQLKQTLTANCLPSQSPPVTGSLPPDR